MYSPCSAKDWRLSEGVTCVMQFDMLHVWEDGSMCGWMDAVYINRDGQFVFKFIPPTCRISRYTLTLFSRYQSRKYHASGTRRLSMCMPMPRCVLMYLLKEVARTLVLHKSEALL